MNEFISQIESHPALIAILIFIGTIIIGVIGFFIKKIFFPGKSKNSAPSINAGGSISAGGDITVGNKNVQNVTNIKNSESATHNLITFEEYIEEHDWNKEIIDHKEVWICAHDNAFQIEIGERLDNFSEKWTKVYPDTYGTWSQRVYLSINGTRIKQLTFVAADGGRIFVPLPKTEVNRQNSEINYIWDRNSLEFKVGRIIGEYYIYNSLEGVAERSKIEIKN